MNDRLIPFNRPGFVGAEAEYLSQAIDGAHHSGDGAFTRRCSELLEAVLGVPKALLTTSCTHALEMAALLLDVGPRSEVVVPSFTFVSTVNAFVLRGAVPVFCDVRPDTLNMDERLLESLITPRTRAVVPVHYAGVGCEMDAIGRIADAAGVAIVEDNAHGLFGRYRGRQLGSFGAVACQSFHETKNFSCGEGGALLLNDSELVERAEILREKGTDRSKFRRGEVDKYSWVDLGSSYLPSDLLAAILLGQLEARDRIQTTRRRIWERYHENLRNWAADQGIAQPYVPDHCEQAYHMYYLLLPSLEHRQAFIGHLRNRGIHAVSHYVPLHTSKMGRTFAGTEGECPVTEDVSDRLVRLPFYNTLDESTQNRIVNEVLSFEARA